MLENFEKRIYELCFFHTLRDAEKFFSHNTVHFRSKNPPLRCKKRSKQFNDSTVVAFQAFYAANRLGHVL